MTAVLVAQEIADKLIADQERAKGKGPRAALEPAAPTPETAAPPDTSTRDGADIETDLGVLIKAQRKNIFKLGALLIEAKAKVIHGDWTPRAGTFSPSPAIVGGQR